MSVRPAPSVDAVIVGGGLAGGWIAKTLTEAGLEVVLLEAGPRRSLAELPRRDRPGPPPTDVELARHYIQSACPLFRDRGPRLFVDDVDHPYEASPEAPFYWIRGAQVGGRSLLWGGTSLRLSRFELAPERLDGCELGWPISADELSTYCDEIETYLGVAGTREGLERLPDGVYERAPAPLTPAEAELREELELPGTRPVPVRYVAPEPRHDGWPAFTAQGTTLADAERSGRLELRAGAIVTRLLDDGRGRAVGVAGVDAERLAPFEVRAPLVFLSAGTIETVRLLLASDLADPSDVVGRGVMDHPVLVGHGRLRRGVGESGFDPPSRQRGLLIPPPAGSGDESVRPFGTWVTLGRVSVDGASWGQIAAQGEQLPHPDNRITLSARRDRFGRRVPRIHCVYRAHERRLHDAMRTRVSLVAEVAGLELVPLPDHLSPPGLNVHELGGARWGRDPTRSVVDPSQRLWALSNVFVADGSLFPSGGWQNPALTIMALALRAARVALTEGSR